MSTIRSTTWNDSVSSVRAWRARTLSVVFLVSACGGDDDAPVCEVASQQRGAWDRGPEPPTRIPEGGGSAAWSGEELYVFGGNVAYAYDPTTRTWRELAQPEPADRSGGAGFWTGTQFGVWGGSGVLPETGRYGRFTNGLLYDPGADAWEQFDGPEGPQLVGGGMITFAEGRLFVWGGTDEAGQWQSGGEWWDYATRTWNVMSAEDRPETTGAGVIAWTGEELLIWGGWNADVELVGTGAAYDPASDRWRPMNTERAPSPRNVGAVWTGEHLVIFGGIGPPPDNAYLTDGAAYSPATDTWRPIGPAGAPLGYRGGYNRVWTGSELFAWSGAPECPFGGLYDLEADEWAQIADDNAPSRRWAATFWTGDEVLMYGGTAGERFYYYDIVTFRPDQ